VNIRQTTTKTKTRAAREDTPRCPKCGSNFISIQPAGSNPRWWILGSFLKCHNYGHEFQLGEEGKPAAAKDRRHWHKKP
jgi:ssDNA-binding Zn-finger/Zn-ribbon topoisomerase 1